MKQGLTFFLILAVLITLSLTQIQNFGQDLRSTPTEEEVSLDKFLSLYQDNEFKNIKVIDAKKLEGYKVEPVTGGNLGANEQTTIYKTNKPIDTSLTELGIVFSGNQTNAGATVDIVFTEKSIWYTLFFESLLPIILMIAAFFFLMRMLNPKGGAGMPFISSAGKLTNKKEMTTRFDDVIGMEEVKEELKEIVDYLKNPEKYHKVGARVPKGVLLHGAPGSGKTLLARAVAGEAHVPFFSASGPEFIEMFVGAGTLKIRDLFKRAKAAGKAIIFIDEIDSIGAKRGNGPSGAHREQENMLNQILTEMDGFDQDTSVIVMAATNRADILDPALLRSGRFDRKIVVSRPTTNERQEMLAYYLKKKKITEDVNLHSIALRTSGLVGADIENIVNEASIKIAKEHRSTITKDDFEYALEKVIMGPEKKLKTIRPHEKQIVTYHELGHAVTAHVLPHADPVEKISIVSRGSALGVTWTIPEEEKYLYSKAKFLDDLVMLLGGRAAEEIFFGKDEITTGASNDFMRATNMAADMVLKYGMDDELGPVMYHNESANDPYYGQSRWYSDKTAELADTQIKKHLNEAYARAIKIVTKHKGIMAKMAEILLEQEYLSKEEFTNIMEDPKHADELLAKIASDKEKLPKPRKTAGSKSSKTTKQT